MNRRFDSRRPPTNHRLFLLWLVLFLSLAMCAQSCAPSYYRSRQFRDSGNCPAHLPRR